jgi:hypothetical protein
VQLVKVYGTAPEAQNQYSPTICLGADKTETRGTPDPEHISTSCVERQNLSMRIGYPFSRSTNMFSKELENHMHALSIYFMPYNFVRIHQTLTATPAMAAGATQKVWELSDIVQLVDDREANQRAADDGETVSP